MNRRTAVVFVFGLLVLAGSSTVGNAQEPGDWDALRGDWKTIGGTFKDFGKVAFVGDKNLGYLFDINGTVMKPTFDATKTPKTIDLYSEREKKTLIGIYEIKDGTLRIAVSLGGRPRPKDYELTDEDVQNDKKGKSSKWVLVLVRKK